MAIAIQAIINGAGGAQRNLVPHKFRDGYFRMQHPTDELSCIHVEDMRSVCRYLHKGYHLAMSPKDGHAMPAWMAPDALRIAVR
jgi:hypothetical protein